MRQVYTLVILQLTLWSKDTVNVLATVRLNPYFQGFPAVSTTAVMNQSYEGSPS